jgi:hypothetical protein
LLFDLTGAYMKKVRKLYESPSGDRWYLIADPSGAVFIHHEANLASGGQVKHEDIAAFLSRGEGPEQRELLRLIGTLVEEHPAHP